MMMTFSLLNLIAAGFVCLLLVSARSVEDHYLVVFKEDVSHGSAFEHVERVRDLHRDTSSNIFDGVTGHYAKLKIYSLHASEDFIAHIREHFSHEIDFIEEDSLMTLTGLDSNDDYSAESDEQFNSLRVSLTAKNITSQYEASPALARLSHRQLADARWSDYVFSPAYKVTPTIYVLDTGAYLAHEEFENRVTYGESFSTDKELGPEDRHGHGTKMMGAALGKTLGVSRAARGVSVQIGDDRGNTQLSAMIAGINYVVSRPGNHYLKVINLSYTGKNPEEKNKAIFSAIKIAVGWGVHIVTSAGNSRRDIASPVLAPANSKRSIAVGSINSRDQRSTFSNYGDRVDFAINGENIHTTAPGPRTDSTTYVSGCSISTAIVSGVIAYLLSIHGPLSPEDMMGMLREMSTIRPGGHSKNTRIIYNGSGY